MNIGRKYIQMTRNIAWASAQALYGSNRGVLSAKEDNLYIHCRPYLYTNTRSLALGFDI